MLLPTIHRTTERVEVVRITDPLSRLTAPELPGSEPLGLLRRFRSCDAAGPACADAYRPARAQVGP
ncbi:hypothetical protein GZL_00826 [Streptomyces sp. 769]|nr:hypothetical protein GZL_00826 [Streptomyces sp. 769]